LFQSKVVPFVPCEGADGTVSAEWRVDVPLVVIDTDYAPFTEGRARSAQADGQEDGGRKHQV
jgi:hypothetical protein